MRLLSRLVALVLLLVAAASILTLLVGLISIALR